MVVVWCRNSIDYNIDEVASDEQAVVVWCRNSIDYNPVVALGTENTVVVWCRNSIDYNTSPLSLTSATLWFGVGIQ